MLEYSTIMEQLKSICEEDELYMPALIIFIRFILKIS